MRGKEEDTDEQFIPRNDNSRRKNKTKHEKVDNVVFWEKMEALGSKIDSLKLNLYQKFDGIEKLIRDSRKKTTEIEKIADKNV